VRSSGGGSIQTTNNTPTYDGGGGWGVGDGGGGGGADGGADDLISIRRRELMGSDISFTETLTIMVIAGFIMLFILAASPWGIIPPRDGGGYHP
jgi:hypothetical protein